MRTLRNAAILFVSFSLFLVGMLAVTAQPAAGAADPACPFPVTGSNGQTQIAGAPESWATTNGTVFAMTAMYLPQPVIVIGGDFTQVRERDGAIIAARNLAAIDVASGSVRWVGTANNTVYSLYPLNGQLYVGGSFSSLNGTSRPHIAAVSAFTGALNKAFKPIDIGSVRAIAVSNSAVFYGGGSQLRAANPWTGADIWGIPTHLGGVRALLLSPDGYERLFVGGLFDSIGSLNQHGLAMVYPSASGQLNPWFAPQLIHNTYTGTKGAWDGENNISLAWDYWNGQLITGQGGIYNSLSERNGWDGSPFWWMFEDADVQTVSQVNARIIAGWHRGHGNAYGCPYPIFGGSVDRYNGGILTDWDPKLTGKQASTAQDANGGINASVMVGGKLYLGGQFNTFGASCVWDPAVIGVGYRCTGGSSLPSLAVYPVTG